MVPYSYSMVDMGGIDLAEANGTVVQGVYEKIVEAMNLCGDLILYNWKFAGIDIPPSAYSVLQQVDAILINGLIQVTELDQITVIGLPPPLVPVSPLLATENGVYQVTPPASGFNPVTVNLSIAPLEVTENGVYRVTPPISGFSPITVNVRDVEYLYNYGLVEGHTPINIFNGSQSSDISYNNDGTAHILGAVANRRFLGFALDLTGISSVEFSCSFRSGNNTIGVIASQTIEDIMNNRGGAITIYPAYSESPPVARVCKMVLDTNSLSGQYYVGILGYEESWSSDLAQMWINRSVH